MSQAR